MRSAYLIEPRCFELRDDSAHEDVGPMDVRIRVSAVGICGSDMHYYSSGRIGSAVVSEPCVLGHECCGVVAEVGSGVSSLQAGDRVAVDPLIHCGQCSQCLADREHTCLNQRFLGSPGQLQGAMREEIVMPAVCCVKVSAEMSVGAAVMAEPLAIGLHALAQLRVADARRELVDQDIAILGAGPIGLCVLAALVQQSVQGVQVVEPLLHRQAMAETAGAAATCEPSLAPEAVSAQHPAGLDAVFECSGETEALDLAIELLKPGGTLVIVGIPEVDRISLDISQLRRKELTIKNVRRQNGCAERAVQLLESGEINLDAVVTHNFSLEESAAAFELVAEYGDNVGKALIHLGEW